MLMLPPSYGGTIGYEEGQIEEELKKSAEDPENSTEQERKDARLYVRIAMMASMFISGANNELYELKMELNNNFAKGIDNWLVDVDKAVQLMNGYTMRREPRVNTIIDSEVAFAQKTKILIGAKTAGKTLILFATNTGRRVT